MDEFTFYLTCKCGNKIEGTFIEEEYSETCFCDCGLVWVIPRPIPDYLRIKVE